MNSIPTRMKDLIQAGILAAALVLLPCVSQASIVLTDDFTGASSVGSGNATYVASATNWYSFNSNGAGTQAVLTGGGSPSPIAGNFLQFGGSSSNSFVVGSFAGVTLSTPGQSLTLTLNYCYSGAPSAGSAFLGLYNDNGSAVAANSYASQASILGHEGYKVNKLAVLGTSDLSVVGSTVAAGAPYFSGGTTLTTASTGVTPLLNAVYSETLTLTLAPNGTSLLIDSTFGVVGGATFSTTEQTLASPLTLTFNEIVFSPASGGNGATKMDNVLLTSVFPEPSSMAMFALGLLGIVALRRYRSPSRYSSCARMPGTRH